MNDEQIKHKQREILAHQNYLSRRDDPIYRNADSLFDWYVAGLAMNFFENPYKTEWTKYNEDDFGWFRAFLTEEYKTYVSKIDGSWEFDCDSNQWRVRSNNNRSH